MSLKNNTIESIIPSMFIVSLSVWAGFLFSDVYSASTESVVLSGVVFYISDSFSWLIFDPSLIFYIETILMFYFFVYAILKSYGSASVFKCFLEFTLYEISISKLRMTKKIRSNDLAIILLFNPIIYNL